MKTLAFVNFKGGVAKTTTVVNLGAALAALGQRVLLVDCDPQAHIAAHLGMAQAEIEEGLEDVLRGKNGRVRDIALATAHKNLFLAPSTNALAQCRGELAERTHREGILRRALRGLESEVDLVLIDSPPDEGILSVNAIYASDAFVVPTTLSSFSVGGVPKVLGIVESLRELYERDWPLLGVLVCAYDRRTSLMNRRSEELLAGLVGDLVFDTRVRIDESVKKAQDAGSTLLGYEQATECPSKAAADYGALAEELVGLLNTRQLTGVAV
ncbi:MAG: ParA family protein [Polyangiaceae bacterium]